VLSQQQQKTFDAVTKKSKTKLHNNCNGLSKSGACLKFRSYIYFPLTMAAAGTGTGATWCSISQHWVANELDKSQKGSCQSTH